ncbi:MULTISPECIES: beta-N-acetylhexosaminidase [unclassified Streptomyces]|uniref:beta-N-acetylhexosaminidase n=1 Tax=unclassified Streptomyces TaxID=2593676 RepID=UPI001661237A|nr:MULTISPECIES: glycoside hydrolase family 20 protein [unclassified Streptomyces]MBD0710939.1 beta-N-acetylglucosaminidase [Streptomyces sp. CBMA291]MBD0717474.1 beta-N-acetylglucosaminidase [Streptomyces sp. CBMA370]
MRYSIRGPHKGPALLATAVTLVAVAACSNGSPTGSPSPAAPAPTGPDGTRATPTAPAEAPTTPTPTPTPTPSRAYPLSSAPRTVPAVRAHEPARGPGWKPASGAGVVLAGNAEGLADEGKLIAGELGIAYRGAVPAGPGDVELALGDPGGAPESYTLVVRDGRVRISGPDEAGVFYGTRTLKQSVKATGAIPEGTVTDRPAKPQRGLNLDIARKPFTAGWIEDRVREMGDLKLNQLGLHFSDDQGFRIASDSHPEIVSARHLTKAEVRRILALAAERHVTVVPEIDSPGHLGAVIAAHPGLQLRSVTGRAPRGAVDIANPAAARIVDELLREYAQLFPGAYWHLGADEYVALMAKDPEATYPGLARAARARYGPDARVKDLATGWLNDRAATVRPTGKTLKAWNDGFFGGGVVQAAEDIEVEYWTGKEYGARDPAAYLSAGRELVNLNDEYLYYVLGQPNGFTYPTGRRIYEQWTPRVLRGTAPVPARYEDRILGARFAVWCDLSGAQTQAQVADGIRMPLAALSQKVWDPGKPTLGWDQFRALATKVRG